MEELIPIKIVLFGYLKTLVPEEVRDHETIEIAKGFTAQKLVEYLQITRYHLGSIIVNGKMAKPEQELQAGDEVKIMPIVGGG